MKIRILLLSMGLLCAYGWEREMTLAKYMPQTAATCTPNPCQNGASCVLDTVATCVCPDGFTGSTCDIVCGTGCAACELPPSSLAQNRIIVEGSADCNVGQMNAICFASELIYQSGKGLTNSDTSEGSADFGCLGAEDNPVWYYFQVLNCLLIDGACTMQITISGIDPVTGNTVPNDFNLAVWGPHDDPQCRPLTDAPMVCDNSNTTTLTIPIVSGKYYTLLVNDPENSGIPFAFSAVTSGTSLSCGGAGVNCTICNPGFYQDGNGKCITDTPSLSVTRSPTQSPTASQTYSSTATPVATQTATASETGSATSTLTAIPTASPTTTQTATMIPTQSATTTASATVIGTQTPSQTNTVVRPPHYECPNCTAGNCMSAVFSFGVDVEMWTLGKLCGALSGLDSTRYPTLNLFSFRCPQSTCIKQVFSGSVVVELQFQDIVKDDLAPFFEELSLAISSGDLSVQSNLNGLGVLVSGTVSYDAATTTFVTNVIIDNTKGTRPWIGQRPSVYIDFETSSSAFGGLETLGWVSVGFPFEWNLDTDPAAWSIDINCVGSCSGWNGNVVQMGTQGFNITANTLRVDFDDQITNALPGSIKFGDHMVLNIHEGPFSVPENCDNYPGWLWVVKTGYGNRTSDLYIGNPEDDRCYDMCRACDHEYDDASGVGHYRCVVWTGNEEVAYYRPQPSTCPSCTVPVTDNLDIYSHHGCNASETAA
eukprot:NODE_456_length_2233_cov_16.114469_g422_i0.p1 GENE.NODE_456_length_2233_cov_16.114469_g422_i0~~NODE_456_length_2233_cov_16.114469_g422_i0.p1  ORF type:complete len:710 (-),score=102.74 NODE_456_length_2233_cov_16.114469_g422_i0:23-2152(-)